MLNSLFAKVYLDLSWETIKPSYLLFLKLETKRKTLEWKYLTTTEFTFFLHVISFSVGGKQLRENKKNHHQSLPIFLLWGKYAQGEEAHEKCGWGCLSLPS